MQIYIEQILQDFPGNPCQQGSLNYPNWWLDQSMPIYIEQILQWFSLFFFCLQILEPTKPRTSKIFSAMDLNNDGNAAWVRVDAEKNGLSFNTNSCNFLGEKFGAFPPKFFPTHPAFFEKGGVFCT